MAARYKVIKYTRKSRSGIFEYDMVLDLTRFGPQLSKAQYKLDTMVMKDMTPYMPMETDMFIDVTKDMSAPYAGTGRVVAAAPPFGRFLYEGKTMVDESTGSPWARKGARKVLVSQYSGKTNANPNLTYANGRTSHWFEKAKEKNAKKWIAHVKKTAGGGK